MKIKLTFIAFLFIIFVSCSKDSETPSTQSKSLLELLTEKAWKADEVRVQLSNNSTAYYKRGGAGNTVNYDSDSLKFNTINTGVYYYLGSEYTTTWNFTNSENSKMTLIINYPTPLTIYLENINITQTYFKYAQYSTNGGISYLASTTRTQN